MITWKCASGPVQVLQNICQTTLNVQNFGFENDSECIQYSFQFASGTNRLDFFSPKNYITVVLSYVCPEIGVLASLRESSQLF